MSNHLLHSTQDLHKEQCVITEMPMAKKLNDGQIIARAK